MSNDYLDGLKTITSLPEVCPDCHATLVTVAPGTDPTVMSEIGMRCPQCGWSIVGTNVPPMLMDQTQYQVCVKKVDEPGTDLLRFLTHELSIGLMDAKERIQLGDVPLLRGSATEVYALRNRLDQADIAYAITPQFEY